MESGGISMTKRVFKYIVDFEWEENWLNEMAAQGWMLKTFFMGMYEFCQGEPGEYIYRLELLPHRSGSLESRKYFSFLEETGIEIVSTWHYWVYYRRKANEGPFDIYSDIDSRIQHHRRVYRFFFPLGIALACYIPLNVHNMVMYSTQNIMMAIILPTALIANLILGCVALKTAWKQYRRAKQLGDEKRLLE